MVMLDGGRPRRSVALVDAAARLAPALALLLLAATSLAILGAAGDTLGYDFQAYARAADRLLAGQPLYDPAVDVAGGFAIYLYPPPFALAVIPFAALPDPAGTWAWLGFLVACFLGGTALLPVRPSVRWTVVALAALSFPFLYGLKLGQVAPILYLCFAIGWRSLDRPVPLGLSTAAGTLVKLQPALLFGWMAVTRRWAALAVGLAALAAVVAGSLLVVGVDTWADYLALLVRVSEPVTTPHNMTPGAVAFRAGLTVGAATVVQYVAMGLTAVLTVFAWFRRDAATGFVVGVVASQLLSPLLWDHYAMLLLLPTALLLQRGQWWAAAHPAPPVAPRRRGLSRRLRRRVDRSDPRPGAPPNVVSSLTERRRSVIVGAAALIAAFLVLWLCARNFDAGRPDFFYLADAFLHGRTWLDRALGPYDVVVVAGRVYVPFAPFPAFVLAPLVAIAGVGPAIDWEPVINALLATAGLGLLWRLAGRLGVRSSVDRAWLLVLFGFSTATWWVTMRGGVWHTGQLIASILTFAGLLEAFGRRRPVVMGLLAGAGFLTRATLLAALPYWAVAFPAR